MFWVELGRWLAANWELLLVGALPIGLSIAALAVALRSLRYERGSAEAAARSANAAERANLLAERLLEREHLIERTEADSSDVAWQITNPSGNLFVLRNTGSDIAEDVTIPPELLTGVPRNLPDGAIVRPSDAIEFQIFGRMGSPVPHTIYVQWRGQDKPQAVPMP